MTIHLVRHGQTEGNARRILQVPELPLSAQGREQATRVAERLASAGIAAVLASDLERAAETARAVARSSGAPLTLEPLLQERNFGALRGRSYDDLGLDPFAPDYAPPEGEAWGEFRERVALSWDAVLGVAADCPGPLAVVTHGLVLRVLAETHLAVPPGLDPPEAWENTCVTTVEERDGVWTVSRLACSRHLSGPLRGDRASISGL